VERLHDWLFDKDTRAADRLLNVLGEAFEGLTDISDRGRRADNDGLRELIVSFGGSRYVVRYEVDHDRVRVTRIWHGREDRQP
jgi:plasmid stabilization system protein ParE